MSENRFPWRAIALVSGALNLLAIGAVAGLAIAGVRLERGAPPRPEVQTPAPPREVVAALPPDLRARVGEEIAQSYRQSVPQRREAAEARRAAYEAAAAEPYDVERVRAAFARMRAADQQAVAVFHDNFAQTLASMSPEQRRSALDGLRLGVAQRMQERRERRLDRAERWRERREQMRGD